MEQHQLDIYKTTGVPYAFFDKDLQGVTKIPVKHGLDEAERNRCTTTSMISPLQRENFSQFLTPFQTARLAASFFSDFPSKQHLRCLDLGTGTGILSVALYERYGQRMSVDAFEIDGFMADVCHQELLKCGIEHKIYLGDVLKQNFKSEFDLLIMNPPYKKMSSSDPRQHFLPVTSPNLYAAFVMKGVEALVENGELVAIIPRSWMNGLYFTKFRKWLFSLVSIDRMHIYGSRTEIFSDTDVLQETMIVKLTKQKQRKDITVSFSKGKDDPVQEFLYLKNELIESKNNFVVRVETAPILFSERLATLKQQGYCASTGKVVDFRNKKFLSQSNDGNCKKLIYSCNFPNGSFIHPVQTNKPQWIRVEDSKVRKQLIPKGSFVVVKRFTSKEEPRRIKAYYLQLSESQALENHLNFIHAGTPRMVLTMDSQEAKGLVLWLNSTLFEKWFRARSGNTQVNASDLNDAPVPDKNSLRYFGEKLTEKITQKEIDDICDHWIKTQGLLV